MDQDWNNDPAWSGSATTVDYGNNIGRNYSNNTTLTGTEAAAATPSSSGGFTTPGGSGSGTGSNATSGGGGGGGGGGGRGGGRGGVDPKSQLTIERMPFETSIETIRSIFGRYGRVARVVCDYRISEERLYCWLDYEDEKVCESALRENGRKMEKFNIVVTKNANSGDDGYRARIPKKDAWGNNTWTKPDRSSTGGASGGNTSSDASWTSGADWNTGGGDAGSSSFDNSFSGEGDDRRSSRGRGRGGRDRGGRGGGRGRGGGGGGGRYQPYDKNEPFEKTELPAWEDILAAKPSSTTPSSAAPAEDDWGNSSQREQHSQSTSAPATNEPLDWD